MKCDIDTINTVLFLSYGIIQSHRANYPLGPVIWTIGCQPGN